MGGGSGEVGEGHPSIVHNLGLVPVLFTRMSPPQRSHESAKRINGVHTVEEAQRRFGGGSK